MRNIKLSGVELYYSPAVQFSNTNVSLKGSEFHHAVKVMRNTTSDEIFVTNGKGVIIKGEVSKIEKDSLLILIKEKFLYGNKLDNIIFCLSKLKNPDRFKFALEKCVELGITNFIIFNSRRSVAKGSNIERWKKITLAAMKQSLRAFLPQITLVGSLDDIVSLPGKKIVFEQTAENEFPFSNRGKETYYFIFGPEGGFTKVEQTLFDSGSIFYLSDHRLRSETAMVKAASLL